MLAHSIVIAVTVTICILAGTMYVSHCRSSLLIERLIVENMKSIRFYLLASFAIGIELSGLMVHVQCSWAIPVVTNRRQSGDTYTILQQDKTDVRLQCPVDNATYLVEER